MNVPPAPHDVSATPSEGILARTLNSSPWVRWIVPARIRCPSKNDFVFVGDTFVELREFLSGEGYLAEPCCKVLIHAQILSAKVISATIEIISILEQTLQQSVEPERYTINGRAIEDDQPPQLLVLSTARSELVFLYARDLDDRRTAFVQASTPLMTGIRLQDRYCLHLANDPESRLLAFAPNSKYCAVSQLLPVDQIKANIDKWRPGGPVFTPWYQQRYIQVDGAIVRMEFLHSPKDEPWRVILVLLVAKQQKTYTLLYSWDSRRPLHTIKPMRSSGQLLPVEDSIPLMLIPCSVSFLLVTQTELVLYNCVTHSAAKRTAYDLSDRHEFEGGHRTKLWTQWAKPKRHENFRKTNDEILLLREDGFMQAYTINVQGDLSVENSFSRGNLNFSVDTAFCFLAAPFGMNGGDILIAGGSMTEGGVFHMPAREGPKRTQTITSGAPVNDLLLLPNALSKDQLGRHQPRIFTCGGTGESQGCLSEIVHGLEADVVWMMEHPDAASMLQMWALEAKTNNQLLLLSSHPLHTALITFDLVTSAPEAADVDTFPGLDLESSTLCAAVLDSDALLQVTKASLRVVSLAQAFEPVQKDMDASTTLCAAVVPGPTTCVVVAHQHTDRFALSICSISNTSGYKPAMVDSPVLLSERPVCVNAAGLLDAVVITVATAPGTIELFTVDAQGHIAQAASVQLMDLAAELNATPMESMCLLSRPACRSALLVCGLRNGILLTLEVSASLSDDGKSKAVCRLLSKMRLARTAVIVIPDEHSRQGAYVTAALLSYGSAFTTERISLQSNDAGAEYVLDRLYLRDPGETSDMLHGINTVARVPTLESAHGIGTAGLLITVSSTVVAFSSLNTQAKAVRKHVIVPGMAKKLVYSKFLKRMIIGVDPSTTRWTVPDSNSQKQGPANASVLCFAQVGDTELESLSVDHKETVTVGEPGETIAALAHYSPTDDRNHFEMILVALRSQSRSESKGYRYSSRIICISDKHVQKGTATPRIVMRLPGKKVTVLCPIGKSGLLIGSGNELLLHNLDVRTKKWSTLTRHTLPSPAREIRVQGSLVYVATERHSLCILKEHNNSLAVRSSDSRARTVSSVVPIHRHHTMIADSTSDGTQLTGIAEDEHGSTLQRTFEITVPHLFDRLEYLRTHTHRSEIFASARDGTMFWFSTLDKHEWALCHFLQGLCRPGMKVGAQSLSRELDVGRWLRQDKGKLTPMAMGINGDVLSGMLEPGQFNLRNLLGSAIKVEDGGSNDAASNHAEQLKARKTALKELLRQATGEAHEEDVVGSAMIWLRFLLQR